MYIIEERGACGDDNDFETKFLSKINSSKKYFLPPPRLEP